MKLLTFISAGAFTLFTAFAMKEKQIDRPSLYGTKWLLKKIHTDAGTENVFTNAYIKFNLLKKTAGGNGSCNTFGSSFIINNHQISINNIYATKMYCDGVQQTEDSFFQQLEKVNRFEIKQKKLLLYRDDIVLLEFDSE
jgi:heat shock protein HslJ